MKILVINGPNLNLLGIREPDIYGRETYKDLCKKVKDYCTEKKIRVSFYQSNHEGDIVDEIQRARNRFDGIIINPGGYTHTSVAIPDAIKAVSLPAVEVHISDVNSREEYRRISYIRDACILTVAGKGTDGYNEAADKLYEYIKGGNGK